MNTPQDRKIVVFGHDADDPDCKTPEAFRDYIANIFRDNQGRYRYTKGKGANIIVLSLGGMAYGHFTIKHEEPPNNADLTAFDKVTHVHIVASATLYDQPVRLWDLGIKAIHIGPQITEEKFAEIPATAAIWLFRFSVSRMLVGVKASIEP